MTGLALPNRRSGWIMNECVSGTDDSRKYVRKYDGVIIAELNKFVQRYEKNVILIKITQFPNC